MWSFPSSKGVYGHCAQENCRRHGRKMLLFCGAGGSLEEHDEQSNTHRDAYGPASGRPRLVSHGTARGKLWNTREDTTGQSLPSRRLRRLKLQIQFLKVIHSSQCTLTCYRRRSSFQNPRGHWKENAQPQWTRGHHLAYSSRPRSHTQLLTQTGLRAERRPV